MKNRLRSKTVQESMESTEGKMKKEFNRKAFGKAGEKVWKNSILLLLGAALLNAGCSRMPNTEEVVQPSEKTEETVQADTNADSNTEGRMAVVSFSWPVTDMAGEDTNTSASVVIENGELMGNTAYAARLIADQTGSDWYQLKTVQDYPTDYDQLIDQASEEKQAQIRPDLQSLPDLAEYDQVILVTPNWWADLPMPVYTFLDGTDWSGKTIIPLVIHGGSGFSDILSSLSEYASTDNEHSLSISRSSLMDSEQQIREWADSL